MLDIYPFGNLFYCDLRRISLQYWLLDEALGEDGDLLRNIQDRIQSREHSGIIFHSVGLKYLNALEFRQP